MKLTLIVLAILAALLFISQLYFIMANTETQPYQIIKTQENFEIRLYPPATMANSIHSCKNKLKHYSL